MLRKRRSVSLSNSRSTLAYRICSTLQEFMVLLKRMSTSSQYKEASDLRREEGPRRHLGLKVSESVAVSPTGLRAPRGLDHGTPITVSPAHQQPRMEGLMKDGVACDGNKESFGRLTLR